MQKTFAPSDSSFYNSFTSFYTPEIACSRQACIFAALIHQTHKTMQIRVIALLLSIQFFTACQQGQEVARSLAAADIGFSSASAGRQKETGQTAAGIVFQSVDGGQTWHDVSAGLPAGLEVWGASAFGGEVFLGTETGLYRSSAVPTGPIWQKEPFLNENITDIFPGRAGPYVNSIDNGLFQETISGTGDWKPVCTAVKNKKIRTVLETADGAILIGSDSGIFKSADGGQTWRQVFVGDMIISIAAMGDVLIGGGYQGVLRSTDGGEHWDNVFDENILAKNSGRIGDRFFTILGTRDPSVISPEGITNRLRISSDSGKTWQRIDRVPAPLPVQSVFNMDARLWQTRDVYDIIQAGKYLFCSFDTGVFRSSDQGKTWEPVYAIDRTGPFTLTMSDQVIYAVRRSGGC